MKQLEVTIKVRNNLLKERRLKMGFSQIELATKCDLPYTVISSFECLRNPFRDAIANEVAQAKVADFFKCSVKDIFPPQIRAIQRDTIVKSVDVDELKYRYQLRQQEQYLLDMSSADRSEAKQVVQGVLETLSEREQQIIDKRFGISSGFPLTLKDVGEQFDVEKERVRQIERKAILKLRHPSRADDLRYMLTGNEKWKRKKSPTFLTVNEDIRNIQLADRIKRYFSFLFSPRNLARNPQASKAACLSRIASRFGEKPSQTFRALLLLWQERYVKIKYTAFDTSFVDGDYYFSHVPPLTAKARRAFRRKKVRSIHTKEKEYLLALEHLETEWRPLGRL